MRNQDIREYNVKDAAHLATKKELAAKPAKVISSIVFSFVTVGLYRVVRESLLNRRLLSSVGQSALVDFAVVAS